MGLSAWPLASEVRAREHSHWYLMGGEGRSGRPVLLMALCSSARDATAATESTKLSGMGRGRKPAALPRW